MQFASINFPREICCFRLHLPISCRKFVISVCISRFPAGNLLFPFASADFPQEICCFRLHQPISRGKCVVSVCIRRFPVGNVLFPFASEDFPWEMCCFRLHRLSIKKSGMDVVIYSYSCCIRAYLSVYSTI